MKRPAVLFASVAAVIVIAAAAWSQSVSPGADIRVPKQVFVKDQARICPFDATEFTGCDR